MYAVKSLSQKKILAVYIPLFFLGWSVYAYFFSASIYAVNPYLGSGIKLLLWTAPVCIIISRIYKQNIVEYLKLRVRNQKSFFRIVGLIAAILIVWNLFFCLFVYQKTFSFDRELSAWLSAVLLIGFTEEFVFRGFILQGFNKLTNVRTANLLQSLLFALIHFPGYFRNGLFCTPALLASSICFVFVFALVQGWAFRKTDTLWCCILIHTLNNFITVGFGL